MSYLRHLRIEEQNITVKSTMPVVQSSIGITIKQSLYSYYNPAISIAVFMLLLLIQSSFASSVGAANLVSAQFTSSGGLQSGLRPEVD